MRCIQQNIPLRPCLSDRPSKNSALHVIAPVEVKLTALLFAAVVIAPNAYALLAETVSAVFPMSALVERTGVATAEKFTVTAPGRVTRLAVLVFNVFMFSVKSDG